MVHRNNRITRLQSGVGLIEVLVALFVLAVGLLGLLTMQTRAMHLSQSAYYQSQAIFLAEDIIERMRSNSSVLENYEVDFDDAVSRGAGLCDSAALACSAAELAESDLVSWKGALASLLPAGAGAVAIAAPSGNLYPVSILIRYQRGDTYTYRLEATL